MTINVTASRITTPALPDTAAERLRLLRLICAQLLRFHERDGELADLLTRWPALLDPDGRPSTQPVRHDSPHNHPPVHLDQAPLTMPSPTPERKSATFRQR